jgi:hypothetical protein
MLIDKIPHLQKLLIGDIVNNITLELQGESVAQRSPNVHVRINHKAVWSGPIVGTQLLHFDNLNISSDVVLEVEYHGKQDRDTVIDHGQIVNNQHVRIKKLEIDQACLQGVDLANLSLTNYNLTASQQTAYNINNFPWSNVKTDVLWNNGIWQITLVFPILTNLLKSKTYPKQIFELDHQDVLNRLQKILEGKNHVV